MPHCSTLLRAAGATLLLILVAPLSPSAHDLETPIDADSVLVQDAQFSFESLDGTNLVVNASFPDPATDGSAVLVYGTGANGGRTELISLDNTKWTPTAGGFAYADPSGASGGITSALVETGVLSLAASAGLDWSPAGAQDEVWVHFQVEQELYCARFEPGTSTVTANAVGHFEATLAAAPGACPEVCGNGVKEGAEACDDGNLSNDDGCDNDCTVGVCNSTAFDSTFDGLRQVIFEEPLYGCTNLACHDANSPAGDLRLDTAADVYAQLVGMDGHGVASTINPLLDRVEISEPALSVAYLKLLSKRLEGLTPGYEGPDVGAPMPVAFQAVSQDHLEALRLWIRAGAPEDLVVEGTAPLLGTCLPPAQPLKTTPPPPADPSVGFQVVQTPSPLAGLAPDTNGEDEICMATYYDLSAIAPEDAKIECPGYLQFRKGCSNDFAKGCSDHAECGAGNTCISVKNGVNPSNECIAWKAQTLLQDAQSHHSIIQIYTGGADTTDPGWGNWTFKFEPDAPNAGLHGLPCDPTDPAFGFDPALGYNPGCSGGIVSSVACGGFGPVDLSGFSVTGGGSNQIGFSGSQEPYYAQDFVDGVYAVLPKQGIIIWNSHAFNTTESDTTMAQYLDIEYARGAAAQQTPAIGIFDARWIFAENIPPFETREVCATHTLPQGANLFQLNSHTHVHGTRFRIWAPPNTPCQPECPTAESTGNPFLALLDQPPFPSLCGQDPVLPMCTGPRQDEPMYFSTDYSDPLQLEIDPPILHDSPAVEDRTYLFCSLFDNGATESSPPVKTQSGSPPVPDLGLGTFIPQALLGDLVGGPCPMNTVACLGGDMEGALCGLEGNDQESRDAFCGEGICDACPVHGGVTTSDEMFILLGTFFIPEPGMGSLGLAALAALGWLAGRRDVRGRS